MRNRRHSRWTQKEIAFLRENAQKLTHKEMSKKIGKSVHAIAVKISRLSLGHKPSNLTGLKFSNLKVKRLDSTKIGRKHIFWICDCKCGNTVSVTTGHLKSGNTTSCGCLKKYNAQKPIGEAPWNRNFLVHKNNSSRSKRISVFVDDFDLFKKICSEKCIYCDSKPKPWNPYVFKKKSLSLEAFERSWINTNNIDRVDNDVGYLLNNSVPCCSNCNFMKNSMNFWDFANHLQRFKSNLVKRVIKKLISRGIKIPPKPINEASLACR